jgi:hypothetical protein
MGLVIALVRRIAARLHRDGRTSAAGLGLPCAVCGAAATGWAIRDRDRHGSQVIDGYAVCAAHQTEDVVLPRTKAG